MVIARQPIFDVDNRVYGYELLYRELGQNAYSCEDGDVATSHVIAGNFLSLDLVSLTGDRKAFINIPGSLLTKDIATLFPVEYLVMEVLEFDENLEDVVTSCRTMKANGYLIAFNDRILKQAIRELIDLADIVKVDFLSATEAEKRQFVSRFANGRIRFLAEKVETRQDFEKAKKLGYSYFQGYYFAKPEILSSSTLSPSKMNFLRLLNAIQDVEPDFVRLADIIEMDASFSYEILRIVNSAFFSRGQRIGSIRQALVTLGLDEVRKWTYIAALRKQNAGGNGEVVSFSMIRGKFLEMFSRVVGMERQHSAFMTVGILSMLDVLAECSMDRILQEIPLSPEVKRALLGTQEETVLSKSFQLILALERGDWRNAVVLARELGVEMDVVAGIHNEAMKWVMNLEQVVF